MSRTIKRLAGPAQVSNAAATKYTVPASTSAIIRALHVQNPSGSPVTFTWSIGADAAGTRLLDAYSIPANSYQTFYPNQVMTAAEVLQAFAGTNNILTLTISGEEYAAG